MSNEGNKYSFENFRNVIGEYASCMDDYPYVLDLKNDVYYISEKAVERFAVPAAQFSDVSKTHEQFVYSEDYQMLIDDLAFIAAGKKEEHDIQYRWLDKDKKPIWINCKGRLLRSETGEPMFMIGCVNEIGNVSRADNVTGMFRMNVLRNRLSVIEDRKSVGYIIRIGIDGFKELNEKFGYDYGDYVLNGIANCVIGVKSNLMQAYYAHSDEFIIVRYDGGDAREAHKFYKKLRRRIDDFIEENKYEAFYTISAGILCGEHIREGDSEDVLKLSQFALHKAKQNGRNQDYIFDKADYEKFIYKQGVLASMRRSVANDFEGFELYFQPLVDMYKKGRIYGAESLLRYTMEDGTQISPVEFIPLLEESGLIIPVGKWVFERAIEMCSRCQQYVPEFKVSINISYVQVLKSNIVREINNIIKNNGVTPGSIVVEMTESGYLEFTPVVREIWEELRQIGIHIALDDFGTGYSNLSSISVLMPDVVKLDRGFTEKALTNDYENELMQHIISMVHSINLKICIEGVETEDDLARLMPMNPEFIQGYYFGRPCGETEFVKKFMIGS